MLFYLQVRFAEWYLVYEIRDNVPIVARQSVDLVRFEARIRFPNVVHPFVSFDFAVEEGHSRSVRREDRDSCRGVFRVTTSSPMT